MKCLKRFFSVSLILITLFCLIGCSQTPAPSIPSPHVPTISENISTLTQNPNYRIKSQSLYYVDGITERETGNVISAQGESVSTSRVANLYLHRVSDESKKTTFSGLIVFPGGSEVKIGQICCLLILEDKTYGVSSRYLVFGG